MRTLNKVLLIIFCFAFNTSLFANGISPVGYWRTIDDVTNKPKAIVEVSLTKNNELEGRILKVFPEPGKEQRTICVSCSGVKKNQPIVGLVVMEQLVQSHKDTNHWEKGTILDPKTGKVYRCQLDLSADNNTMKVRGFIGFALLGRTQHWERVENKIA